MSWFQYGKPLPKKRNLRKGVWLRVSDLPEIIYTKAKLQFRSKQEEIRWVVVQEIRPNNKVLLEFWCQDPFKDHIWKTINGEKTLSERYTVFHLLVDENPEWICEGDLGRGYKEAEQ